jgi:[CysO sulfur-carrier protein]-S-L-cysteine hydrolase
VSERPFRQLVVPPGLYAAIFAQAQAEAPLECCGLLAGEIREGIGSVKVRYPLVNEAASPVEFVSAARGMFDAMRDIDRRGLQMLAAYHSHPASRPVPSKTDLERNYSPDVVNIIVSLQTEPPEMRAWWLRESGYEEALLSVIELEEGDSHV